MSRCVQCGYPAERHGPEAKCPTASTEYADMALPKGLTCNDCRFFRFCSQLIGPEIDKNTECDWYPVRFQFNVELLKK